MSSQTTARGQLTITDQTPFLEIIVTISPLIALVVLMYLTNRREK